MNRRGFTLIEVLIGLVILAFGLLAIAGMQVTSVRGNFFSNYLTLASYAGQDRLEFLDNLPYSSAQLSAGNHTIRPQQLQELFSTALTPWWMISMVIKLLIIQWHGMMV